jgi:hypothetical protein
LALGDVLMPWLQLTHHVDTRHQIQIAVVALVGKEIDALTA